MIFIDTSAIFALYNVSDPHHTKALSVANIIKEGNNRQITTNLVISEALTIISMRLSKQAAIQFGTTISSSSYECIFITENLRNKAWEIFQKVKNKDVSFADCTSFAVMEHLGIKQAFSFDVDFKKYGFELV